MKENYVSHVIEEFVADDNFDAKFGDGWIDEDTFAGLGADVCDYAFAPYGIDAKGRYANIVDVILDNMVSDNVIIREGDDYSGYWYLLRPTHKKKYLEEIRSRNPATLRISSLGEEALRRALLKIVDEDGLRSMDAKWAEANNSLTDEVSDVERDGESVQLPDGMPHAPNPGFFSSEGGREEFVALADKTLKDVEASDFSNSEKSQARGFLVAAKALSETPEPPADLIWTLLTRASTLAGIGSFFLALITLIGMVI